MNRRIGALTIISLLLICSAGLRIIGVSSVAIASSDLGEVLENQPPLNDSKYDTENLEILMDSFKSREEALKSGEAENSIRKLELENIEEKIELKLQALEKSEIKLRELLEIANSATEDDVARLTAVYENMKPKNAAVVFEEMDPTFAAGFLARMRPDFAAMVMAGLKPQTAYAVSVVLAGRHFESAQKDDPN